MTVQIFQGYYKRLYNILHISFTQILDRKINTNEKQFRFKQTVWKEEVDQLIHLSFFVRLRNLEKRNHLQKFLYQLGLLTHLVLSLLYQLKLASIKQIERQLSLPITQPGSPSQIRQTPIAAFNKVYIHIQRKPI